MFRRRKTLHEEAMGDFRRKVEERFLQDGKKVAKMCSVFLHKNVQHAVDEWWLHSDANLSVSGQRGILRRNRRANATPLLGKRRETSVAVDQVLGAGTVFSFRFHRKRATYPASGQMPGNIVALLSRQQSATRLDEGRCLCLRSLTGRMALFLP